MTFPTRNGKIFESLWKGRGQRGPQPINIRQKVNAMLYVSRTGCQWRYLPKDFPPWNTVAKTFYRWKKMGVWDKIHHSLREQCRQKAGREKKLSTPS